jgi:mannose-6-phosphate isomerase-like protein (cupin superfamily)
VAYKEKLTAAGRTYNFTREGMPTRIDGPDLVKINLKDPSIQPSNFGKAEGTPLPILGAQGVRIDVSKRTHEAMNFWHRNGDQDEVILCIEGQIHWETEIGNVTLNAGEMLVIPRGVLHRSLPGTPPEGGNNLILELKIDNPVKEL